MKTFGEFTDYVIYILGKQLQMYKAGGISRSSTGRNTTQMFLIL